MNVTLNVQPGNHIYGHVENLYQDSLTDHSTHPTQVNIANAHEQDENKEIITKLIPIFKGDESEVQRFCTTIQGADPTVIISLVNDLLKANKIVPEAKNKILWSILNQHGLYPKTLNNWNDQIG